MNNSYLNYRQVAFVRQDDGAGSLPAFLAGGLKIAFALYTDGCSGWQRCIHAGGAACAQKRVEGQVVKAPCGATIPLRHYTTPAVW